MKPDALPDLALPICKTDARMALQRNQKVSERAGNLCSRACPETARAAAKLHRFDTGQVLLRERLMRNQVNSRARPYANRPVSRRASP